MMTRTQKTAIPEMRTEAIAYGAIAEQPGMSLGSVMMFVSHHNRADDRRCERRWKRLSKGPGHGTDILLHEMQDAVVEGESYESGGAGTARPRDLRRRLLGQQGIQILLPSVLLCLNAQVTRTGSQAAACRLFCPLLISTRQMVDQSTTG